MARGHVIGSKCPALASSLTSGARRRQPPQQGLDGRARKLLDALAARCSWCSASSNLTRPPRNGLGETRSLPVARSRGAFRLLATTTPEGERRIIERDPLLYQRFTRQPILEPTPRPGRRTDAARLGLRAAPTAWQISEESPSRVSPWPTLRADFFACNFPQAPSTCPRRGCRLEARRFRRRAAQFDTPLRRFELRGGAARRPGGRRGRASCARVRRTRHLGRALKQMQKTWLGRAWSVRCGWSSPQPRARKRRSRKRGDLAEGGRGRGRSRRANCSVPRSPPRLGADGGERPPSLQAHRARSPCGRECPCKKCWRRGNREVAQMEQRLGCCGRSNI